MFWAKKIKISIFLVFLPILCLAACQEKALITEKDFLGTPTVRLGDTTIADVDGTKIYLSDIQHMALAQGLTDEGAQLTPKDPIFHRVLDELIDQRLLALEALKRSYDREDEAGRRLALARERILSGIVVEKLIAEKITDESIMRMYDEQKALRPNDKQVHARQIIVETEKLALELKELVEKSGNFSTLAKEFSIDNSTRDLGGDLRYFSKNAIAPEIANVAFATEKGTLSAPFKTDAGWHILLVVNTRIIPHPQFKDIKSDIVTFMTHDEISKKIENLRSTSNIQLQLGQNSSDGKKEKVAPSQKKENKDGP